MNSREDEEFLLSGEKKVVQRPKQASKFDIKLVAFFCVGVVSFIYVIAELAAAIKLDSLVLLSDGFHNLSDVISLGIAYWARQAAKRNSDDSMSYGWARTEILGGLTNGCFLLSLVVYVMLESIPKLIKPVQLEDAMLFIIISASGLTVNLIGTIIFAITGQGHSHSHSHGGHSHGHDHGHKEKKDKKKKKIEHVDSMEMNSPVITVKETNNLVLLDDHVEESPKKEKKEKKEGHGHSHGHGHAEGEKKEKKEKKEGHGHSHEHPEGEKKEKKEKKEGHGHSHEHPEGEKKVKKEKKEGHGHSHDHGHAEGEKKEKKEKKGHGHSHDHGHDDEHDHGHKEGGKKKEHRDENVHAVFLHFLGDAISSLMVLGAGLLLHFFKGGPWTAYIDPVSSLIISVLILYTTIPLIKRCSMVLLQHSGDINVNAIRKKIVKVEGLLSVHDLHIWQLVDGMTIASVHVAIEEGVDFTTIVAQVKKIFHKNGVHSTSIQPEFVPRNFQTGGFCVQNCVEDCGEDWCCKKSVDNLKALEEQYSIRAEM